MGGRCKQAKQVGQQKYFQDSEAFSIETPDFQIDEYGFLFIPKRGDHKVDAAKGGAFWRSLEPPWPILAFLPPGVFVVLFLC